MRSIQFAKLYSLVASSIFCIYATHASELTPPYHGASGYHHELPFTWLIGDAGSQYSPVGSIHPEDGVLKHGGMAVTKYFGGAGIAVRDEIRNTFSVNTSGKYRVTITGNIEGQAYSLGRSSLGYNKGVFDVTVESRIYDTQYAPPSNIAISRNSLFETDVSPLSYLLDAGKAVATTFLDKITAGSFSEAYEIFSSITSLLPDKRWRASDDQFSMSTTASLESGKIYQWGLAAHSEIIAASLTIGGQISVLNMEFSITGVSIEFIGSSGDNTALLPDFEVLPITLEPMRPRPGDIVTATVVVQNRGDAFGDAGYLDVWYHAPTTLPDPPPSDYDEDRRVGNLGPGETKEYVFNFVASEPVGTKTFRAFVDSTEMTEESSRSGNQMAQSYVVLSTEKVKTPALDPNEGSFSGNTLNVNVTTSTEHATILYTTGNGTSPGADPTLSSSVVPYDGMVAVPLPGWIKAKAWRHDMVESDVVSGVYHQDGQEGYTIWKTDIGQCALSSPAIGDNGTIYIGSGNSLYALNSNGTVLWMYLTGGAVLGSPAIAPDGTIYIGSFDKYLYAISPDGSLKWRYLTGDSLQGSPAIGLDGALYFGSFDEYFYALNPDGSLRWRYLTLDEIRTSPAIGVDGNLYVTSGHYLYSFQANGSFRWRNQIGYSRTSPAIGGDGSIYVGVELDIWDGGGGRVYAFSPAGEMQWTYGVSDTVNSSPSIGIDGEIYFGSMDRHVYALNSDGSLRSRQETSGWVHGSPAIGADGVVYIASNDGHLYAINSNGTIRWRYKTNNGMRSSPAIANGVLYISSYDNHIYVVKVFSAGLADSPWPMYGRNVHHTRNSFSAPVETPAFNPDGGTHSVSSVNVTITCDTVGATIRYTVGAGSTPGADPTEATPDIVASGETVEVPVPGWLKARACKDGMDASGVKSAVYSAEAESEWTALGTGLDSPVWTLAVDGVGNLYAGGTFTLAGGVNANHIARWNGTAWSALNSGLSHSVYDIEIDSSDNIYATVPQGVARWDNGSWVTLGSGMSGAVTALATDSSGAVYAGGPFTTAGGVNARGIAKWNGSAWSALGEGLSSVYDLAVDASGVLFAAAYGRVSKWNGNTWELIGSSFSDQVTTIAVDSRSGAIYAGGYFAQDIARWNDNSWSMMNWGKGYVRALAIDGNGNLYASGGWTQAVDGYVVHIWKWDGHIWTALGSGMNDILEDLVIDGAGYLYAGGGFTIADGKAANRVARYQISAAPDTTPPTVTITSPTSAASWTSPNATMNIGGEAEDDVDVTRVTVVNDRDGELRDATGTTSWQLNDLPLFEGQNVITVTAYDAAENTGMVSLTVTYNACTLGEALNAPDLTWTTGGHANWFCQTTTTRDGLAAQSGSITHNQQSWLQTTVTGPGTISFWWKVSSESLYDFLRFYIGNTEKQRISGNVDWQQRSYYVPSGAHTLKWQYDKDRGEDAGSDCGWVDQVVFEPGAGMFPSGGGTISDRRPQFSWPAVSGATWYRLWISRDGQTYMTDWVEGATTWTPPTRGLPVGYYRWAVQPWAANTGYGAWSPTADFRITGGAPGLLTLISPTGAQTTHNLTYRWTKDANATWYRIGVTRIGVGTWHDRWVQISGTGEASVNPGSWHPGVAKPVLTAPAGTISGNRPTFQWTGAKCSWQVRPWGPEGNGPLSGPVLFSIPYPAGTWFRVYVNRVYTTVIDEWITSGSLLSPINLQSGTHRWWLGVWDRATGRTIWSDPMDFRVP